MLTSLSCATRHSARRGVAGNAVRALAQRTFSANAGVPAVAAASIRNLVSNLNSTADVEDLLLTYGVPSAHMPSKVRPLVVVKVGGEVITKDIDNLVSSLRFMRASGLLPIVIHGGGPQLNDELAKAGVSPQYIGGHRVTDAPTMAVARRVFEAANDTLAAALRAADLPVTQLKGGIFAAKVADPALGLVGEITSVAGLKAVNDAIAAGSIPVLTSLGIYTGQAEGSVLNINADVAARELAIAVQPLKVVFISAGGGWKEEGVVVAEVDMANDFDRMEARDYTGRQGTLLKLREMKKIIDKLPAVSSVTIASASALASQLLPHRGPGTQIRRGVKLHTFTSLGAMDRGALEAHLRACGGTAGLAALNSGRKIAAIFATEGYTAAAIVLAPVAPTSGVSAAPLILELASMTLTPTAGAEGVEAALWSALKAWAGPTGGLAWESVPSSAAAGGVAGAIAALQAGGPSSASTVFPALSSSRSASRATVTSLLPNCNSLMVWAPSAVAGGAFSSATVLSSGALALGRTAAVATAAAVAPPVAAAPAVKMGSSVRVGLLGARGFVGRELLKLIAGHPDMVVVAAGSRALAGKDVVTALDVPEASAAVAPGTTFSDIGVEQLTSGRHAEVDVWVLALPNGLCAPHAAAIESRAAAQGVAAPLMIDLSADMRFDTTKAWTYGLPESPGARKALASARRISNPGCYATGSQAALLPLLPRFAGLRADGSADSAASARITWLPSAKPHIFGVSGYSGAGTTPSDKNDPARLRDNLLAYALTGHIHEREIGFHTGLLTAPGVGGVAFMPHVAPFFQGIHLTVTGHVAPGPGVSGADIAARFASFYAGQPLMTVLDNGKDGKAIMPDVASHGTGRHGVTMGGFTYDASTGRVVLVSVIDNLLKGAATQALQNVNLALGLPEYCGIPGVVVA